MIHIIIDKPYKRNSYFFELLLLHLRPQSSNKSKVLPIIRNMRTIGAALILALLLFTTICQGEDQAEDDPATENFYLWEMYYNAYFLVFFIACFVVICTIPCCIMCCSLNESQACWKRGGRDFGRSEGAAQIFRLCNMPESMPILPLFC